MLGSWVGMKEDVDRRLRRAGGLWAKVKEQLKKTRLSKRWQARIVQACVVWRVHYCLIVKRDCGRRRM